MLTVALVRSSSTRAAPRSSTSCTSKKATASLNLSTFIALYNDGYENVYELGPLIDIEQSQIPFEMAR